MMWQPESGCGDRCRGGGDEAAAGVRQVLRIGALIAVLLAAVPVILLFRRTFVPAVARAQSRRSRGSRPSACRTPSVGRAFRPSSTSPNR